MLFFPFRADIKLHRLPILTILISLLCLFIYWQQSQSEARLYEYTSTFCAEQKGKIHKVVMNKLARANNYSKEDICHAVFLSMYYSTDKQEKLVELVENTTKFSTKNLDRTHLYIENYITKKYEQFAGNSPDDLSVKLSYDPDSLNILKMISSSFAHGSWSHVIGNLFFFFAFAATVEAIVGILLFPVVILALAIGTNLVYSLAVMTSPESVPTLGLSGVVMGTMGLFTYFIPTAKIRCFFWFLIIIRKFGIPAWILALWYFGWDAYDLYQTGNSGGVNLVAHVSGFIEGFLIGILLFKKRKKEVHAVLNSSNDQTAFRKAMNM